MVITVQKLKHNLIGQRKANHYGFFAKQFIDLSKTGHKKNTKTYHYILLTNVSIKSCIT